MKKIKIMLIAVDLMIACVFGYFAAALYDMMQMSGKPFWLLTVLLILTLGISAALRFETETAEKGWYRWIRPLCLPYCWMAKCSAEFISRAARQKGLTTRKSCLHSLLFHLPVLPVNLAVSAVIMCSHWGSAREILFGIIATTGVYLLVGSFTYLMLECVYQLSAYLMERYLERKL